MNGIIGNAENLLWYKVAKTVIPIGVLVTTTGGDSVDPYTLQPTADINVVMVEGIITSYSSKEYSAFRDVLGLGANSRRLLIHNKLQVPFSLTHKLLTWKNAPVVKGVTLLKTWDELTKLGLSDTGIALTVLTDGSVVVPQGALVRVDSTGTDRFLMYSPDSQYTVKRVRQYVPGALATVVLDCIQEDDVWTVR